MLNRPSSSRASTSAPPSSFPVAVAQAAHRSQRRDPDRHTEHIGNGEQRSSPCGLPAWLFARYGEPYSLMFTLACWRARLARLLL